MEDDLVGAWEVIDVRAHDGIVLMVIGGLVGDLVQLTENNRFIVWQDGHIPHKYKYCVRDDVGPGAVDIYSVNPRNVNHAIYAIDGGELTICAASAGHDRPTDFLLANMYHMIHRYRRSDAIK
jgi:uncharacterized protein (TIGR03067 family)